jgi:PAS domain S-box-containing protein
METDSFHKKSGRTTPAEVGVAAHTDPKIGSLSNTINDATTGSSSAFLLTINSIASVFANSQEGVFLENEHRTVLFVNRSFCKTFGINNPPEHLTGSETIEIFRKYIDIIKDPVAYINQTRQFLNEKISATAREIETTDGRFLNLEYAPFVFNNVYAGNLWKFTDVTERKLAEEKIVKQKQFYERILNNMPGDIAAFDKNHKYLFLNPEAVRNPEMREWLIGRDDEEYCRYTNKPYKIAETRNLMFEKVRATRNVVDWEEKLTGKDGRTEYHHRKMYPVFDNDGQIEMVIGYSLNVTRNKLIEEQAQKSQKRYKEIFNYSQAWIVTHTLNGEILTINPAACRILGYKENEMVGRNISSFLQQKMRKEFEEDYLQKIKDIGVTEGVLTINNRSGDKIHLLYQNYLLSEADSDPYIIGFAQNITDRLYAEEALKRSEEKYRKIIENMNLGMLEIDAEDRIIFANQQFCNMSGYSMLELSFKKANDLFLEDAANRVVSEKTWRRQMGISNKYEIQIKTKSGDSKWWLASTAPLHNPDGSIKGSISIHLDISRQKKMEKDLRVAMQNAENSSQAKEAFLANMSHEIRTPINAIMGMGKLLSKSNLNKQQLFYLSSIRTASENLLVVINDVLDISKIEAGKVTLETIAFDIENLSKHAITMLSPKAEEKGLEITCEIDKDISHSLMGDPYRINQVLINMLSNAIKFTEAGHIHFAARLVGQTGDLQKILITVEDTGVGISDDYLSTIFNKFTQEDETVVRKFGGTGLGMSITKQLMELMGGSIDIVSKKNVGTTIRLTFELKIGTQKILEKKRAVKTDTSNLGNKKVLLVEDNELNRLLAYTILTQYGALVTSAENGLVAIECIEKEDFDIILMDVQMPVLDGVKATQIIREKHNAHIPIIALTANALKGRKEEYLKAGMNDYIAKPYNEEKMIAIISNWLHRADKAAQVPNSFTDEPEVVVIDPDAPLFDIKKLMVKCGDNAEFVTQMLSLFVTDVPQSMLKIREANEAGDYKTVRYLAHRIRPALLNMSINSIRDESLRLENLATAEEKSLEMDKIIDKMTTVINLVTAKLKAEHNI